MKVPIRWLRDYVNIEISTADLADRLTMAGLEVGSIECIPSGGIDWSDIVVGEVISVEKHPDADRLLIAKVEYGDGEKVSVTGAPNLAIGESGQRVPIAKLGAKVINAYSDDPPIAQVKSAKLRGVSSEAVICSEKELGISDYHDGVLILDPESEIGTPLIELLGDEVLDIELTPNLGRCLSIIGIAREVAALTDAELNVLEPGWNPSGDSIDGQADIEIEDPDLCPRYTASIVKNVNTTPAPFWMRYRLLLAGVRPISNIVDITNYVMFEWGQPLHAFDYDALVKRAGGSVPKITVRRARQAENMTTLDNVERKLDEDMLLITDSAGPVALAGVMGGLDTEVEDHSTSILIEAANFHSINNRRTSTKLGLPSEASHRFSREVPAAYTEMAQKRAAELMRELAGGIIQDGILDAYPKPPEIRVIELPNKECERLLGIPVSPSQISEILEKLDFETDPQKDSIKVIVPHYRLDVAIPADLVEEVARVIGYDNLPPTLMSDRLPTQQKNISLDLEEQARNILTGSGLSEVINYSLTSPESIAKLFPNENVELEEHVVLANPISNERTHMRKTLQNGLLQNVADNQRHQDHIAIYEVARVYLPNHSRKDNTPDEPRRIALALAGSNSDASWAANIQPVDFFDLKGIVEKLLEQFGIMGVSYERLEHLTFHPGRSAAIHVNGTEVGCLGEIHPNVAENFDIRGRVCLAELDLELLIEKAGDLCAYDSLPRYPGIRQDLAIVVDAELPAKQLESVIWDKGGELVKEIQLFDVYEGEQVPEGKKSLAYSLFYRSDERTLKDEEAQQIHQIIQTALESEFGAQVRGVEAT
jgi:phenylalanyl-tRNA synthetase beta chain